jgi:two-component system LytT family sensor kinase
VIKPELILITLLVKLGVAAAFSGALARSRTFQNLLFTQKRRSSQTLGLLALIVIPLALGVWARVVVPNFFAANLSFEITILLGILVGPMSAIGGAIALSFPAMLHHEYLALPFDVAVAVTAGLFGKFAEEEEVW